ncbi:RNA-directed DNA polymerase [Salinibacter ruber]|uniref:RNA-directed DNA polymerase n=1 Tax=Salinibacter ruber TaxID=146919 RepID=UPI000E58CE4A|nr:RNA-directed DNA polymerase [Salinibacter ruber]
MIEKLNIDLAFDRTLFGLSDDINFIDRPLAIQLVERNYDTWKEELAGEIESGYKPSDATPFLVPKGGDLVRNGRHLTIKDRTVYNACVTNLQPCIYGAVGWSQGNMDLSYQLSENHELQGWFDGNHFDFWTQFREDSCSKLEEHEWVAEADIASFYDNIDIRTLKSDLEREGADEDVTRLVVSCLQRWSIFEGRGIPQAYNSSHILAKLYLNTLDEKLYGQGFDHLRYNDDIRIFCKNKYRARQSLKLVFSFLYKRGLSLQSAKTKISKSDEAIDKINEVQKIIEPIENEVRENSTLRVERSGNYNDVFIEAPPEDINAESVRKAANNHLVNADDEHFSSTLFHYLINSLGKVNDDILVDYCFPLISKRPEETSHILRYFERLGVTSEMTERITDYVSSERSVYDYQLHKIYEWFLSSDLNHIPNSRLISTARDLAFDGDRDFYLRNITRRYLGEYGSPSDFDGLREEYSVHSAVREQVVILSSLKRMVKSKRNGFYAEVENDGWAQAAVTSLVKNKH